MNAPRRAFAALLMLMATVPATARQAEAPALSRAQRAALQALVRAVDDRKSDIPVDEADWPLHLLRASDGSHYVAFSLHRLDGLRHDRPVVLYVRLASTRTAAAGAPPAERSAVAEWLAGQTPVPALPRRGIAFGEMPTYGAAGIGQRVAGLQAQNLQLLELERERARERREKQERERKAALEGEETARVSRPVLPFEDFDVRALPVTDRQGAPLLRRSLTAGPGDYELSVAWVDAEASPPSAVRVARRGVTLPAASAAGLAFGSVIVADEVVVRETPVPAEQQTGQPYAIGMTQIVPARDHLLAPDERLALIVQVINARGSETGKPDVEVAFRVFRRHSGGEENIGSLAPQSYNELTLPIDFDVGKGHPIFAAVAVPLRTFRRGEYRMEIAAHDRIAGAGTLTDVTFTVAATPASLLAEAPPLAPAFDPRQESLSAVAVIRGGVHASDGNDRAALAAWQGALETGAAGDTVWPLMADAWLRLGDPARALDVIGQALAALPDHPRLTRQRARALILTGRQDEALQDLERLLTRMPDDREAEWLRLHALFAGLAGPRASESGPASRARFVGLALAYAEAGGAHAALARDWAASLK